MQNLLKTLCFAFALVSVGCSTYRKTVSLNVAPQYAITSKYNWSKTAMDSLKDTICVISVRPTKWTVNATNNDVTYYLSADKLVELETIGGRVTAISILNKNAVSGVTYITE